MTITHIILILATVSTGLITGLLFGFLIAINPAFTRLPDAPYIVAMQAINRVIVNPLFILNFLGAGILLPLAAFIQGSWWLWLAAALYAFGVLGVTIGGNIPLNNVLDKFPLDTATPEAAASARAAFASTWNKWHVIRTCAALLAFISAVAACVYGK
ncbi:putative membrane protein [Chitinophaga polysaccharea]|uniref:Putative membrane protein n=1 Tax=Chitinophaga polysaccharea TaxID=1293035 RepID=A0A561Q4J5_9BACT|nr:anthrone oxygenase family protein [Chitinophaga polysaccharea]TWF45301.1 putative membrane protein [Chitinophaga polysaccharea]